MNANEPLTTAILCAAFLVLWVAASGLVDRLSDHCRRDR